MTHHAASIKHGNKKLAVEVDANTKMWEHAIYHKLMGIMETVAPFADNPTKEIEHLTQTLEAFGFKNVKVTVSDLS